MSTRLNRHFSLFVCDLQRKIIDKTCNKDITKHINFLLQSSHKFKNFNNRHIAKFKPQYFGSIHGLDNDLIDTNNVVTKETYTMLSDNILNNLNDNKITDVVLTGIETQWCITHTSLDLLDNKFKVHIPIDAVSSQSKVQHDIAIQRLISLGCHPCTSLSIVSEMLKGVDEEETKWYVEYYKTIMKDN